MSSRFGRQKKRKLLDKLEVLQGSHDRQALNLRNTQAEAREAHQALNIIYNVVPVGSLLGYPHTMYLTSVADSLSVPTDRIRSWHNTGPIAYQRLDVIRGYIFRNEEAFEKMIHYRIEYGNKRYAYAMSQIDFKHIDPEFLIDRVAEEIARVLVQEMINQK